MMSGGKQMAFSVATSVPVVFGHFVNLFGT